MNIRSVWVVRAVVLTAFLFSLVSSSWGQTGRSAAVTANRSARVSVPVDWSTDHVVAPMIQWGGARMLATSEPRVRHRWLLAQPRANGRTISSVASGSLYFENVNSAADDSAGEPLARGARVGDSQSRVFARRPRRFRQRSFVIDWSFPATGGLGGSVVGSPAKFVFDITTPPSCTNDILYVPIDVVGTASRANLLALRNLYTNPSGTGACSGTGPTIYWTLSLNGGRISTSPVLSLDGTLLFVVESRSTGAIVHAIPTGSVTCPGGGCTLTSPGSVTDLWSATLSGLANDTISSPFIRFTFTTPNQDELFVGDDAGFVHRFNNILVSTGAEVVNGTWPVSASVFQLGSPSVNPSTGNLFVGSADGILHRVAISTGAITNSAAIGGSSPFGGIVDAPVIDVANQRVLVTTGNFGSGLAALLAQFPESFASGASPTIQKILGPGGIANMHRPAFDDAFFSTGSGFTYVGGLSTDGSDTIILRFPYSNASGLGTPAASVSLTNTGTPAGGETSPVTVFRNANTGFEFAYISGLASAEQFVNRINTADFTAVVNFDPQLGGTSPIIVDNIGTGSEQSNIYFGRRSGASSRVVKLLQQF